MQRSTDRVLTTHTGSFERPEELAKLIVADVVHEDVDRARLAELTRQSINDIVAKQVEVGVDVISDGELSKPGYLEYAGGRIEGFGDEVDAANVFVFHDLDDYPEITQRVYEGSQIKIPVCTGPLKYVGHEQVNRDIANFKAALEESSAVDAFIPATSPGLLAMSSPNRHYSSYEEYALAMGEAMNSEYRAIVDAGFVLQVDSPDLAFGADMETWMWNETKEKGFRHIQEINVAALNVALQGINPQQVRMHLCWANYNGPHVNDIPLKDALEPALKANVAGYMFEAANAAHAHEWTLFEELKLPDGKLIIPGVIDSKVDIVERPELVAQRIKTFTNLVGRENVIAGVDCGFGCFVGVLMVRPKIAWLKLRSLAEGARIASGG